MKSTSETIEPLGAANGGGARVPGLTLSSAVADPGVGQFPMLAQVWRRVHHRIVMPLKIIVERHSDGYVAYPLGFARGVVVGQGESYEAALADVRSAIAFHLETFGPMALESVQDDPILEAFVAETSAPA